MQQYELNMRIIIHNVYYTNKDYGGFDDWHTITHTAGGVVIVMTHPNRYSKRGGFYLQSLINQL